MAANWFVGIPVRLPVLDDLLAQLPQSCRGFHPEDLHLTVAFLGKMDTHQVSSVTAVMAQLETKPLNVCLGEARALPSERRPSAFSFELSKGKDCVSAWISAWRDPLIAAGKARSDGRLPLPHLTVARPIRKTGALGRRQGLAWLSTLRSPEVSIRLDRLALYTWSDDRRDMLFKRVFEKVWPET